MRDIPNDLLVRAQAYANEQTHGYADAEIRRVLKGSGIEDSERFNLTAEQSFTMRVYDYNNHTQYNRTVYGPGMIEVYDDFAGHVGWMRTYGVVGQCGDGDTRGYTLSET